MNHAKAIFWLMVLGVFIYGCGGDDEETETVLNQLGESCTADSYCKSNLCITSQGYCTQTCDIAKSGDCPEGYKCSYTELSSGRSSYFCVRDPLQQTCEANSDCPTGHQCDSDTKHCFIFTLRSLCAPCDTDKQCGEGNKCLSLANGERVCGRACSDNNPCSASFECVNGQCQPGEARNRSCSLGKKPCSPCSSNMECGGANDLCVINQFDGLGYCARDCSTGTACPTGFVCADLSSTVKPGVKQCVPESGVCDTGFCNYDAECPTGRKCLKPTDDPEGEGICSYKNEGGLCEPCQNNEQCSGTDNYCLRALSQYASEFPDTEPFCSISCTGANGQADVSMCPLFFDCALLETSGTVTAAPYQCIPSNGSCLSGITPIGGDCSQKKGQDCLSSLCLEIGNRSICTAVCEGNPDICPVGLTCTETEVNVEGATEKRKICVPEGGLVGDDCSPGQPPCASGLCLDMTISRICTKSCYADADCPTHFTCRPSKIGDSEINVCFPAGGGNVGDECTTGADSCATQLCIERSSGNVCTVYCSDTKEHSDCTPDVLCANLSKEECKEKVGESNWFCQEIELVGYNGSDSVPKGTVCVPPQ